MLLLLFFCFFVGDDVCDDVDDDVCDDVCDDVGDDVRKKALGGVSSMWD